MAYPAYVDFTGVKADGTIVSKTIALDSLLGFQLVTLGSDFQGLISASFTGEAGANIRFDNFTFNTSPIIDSNGGGDTAHVTISENTTAITTAHATDPDAGTTLTYAITGGADAALFQINAATGALSFKSAPDFENPADAGGDNVYDVVVSASDGTLSDTQAIAVTVGNAIDSAELTGPVYPAPGGNSFASNGQSAGRDAGQVRTYSGFDASKVDNLYWGLNPVKAAMDGAADAPGETLVLSSISADGLTATYTGTTNAPGYGGTIYTRLVVTIQAASSGTAHFVTAGSLGYSTGPAALVDVDESVGSFSVKMQYQAATSANGVYDSFLDLYDAITTAGGGAVTSSSGLFYGHLLNQAPVIDSNGGGASAAVLAAENGTAVTTVHATDPNAGDTVTYAITGGADAGLFAIDAATGVLSFKAAPDFEHHADASGDGVYDVTVTASDGTLSDTQAIAVTVTDVDEAPVVSGPVSVTIDEDHPAIGVPVGAVDPEGQAMGYGTGGATGPQLGSVTFNADGSFNYTPFENVNGTDTFTILVSDVYGNTAEQTVTVTIDPVNDAPVRVGGPLVVASTPEDHAVTIGTADLTGVFFDADGDALEVRDVSANAGSVTDNGDGTFTLTPPADFNGTITLSYTVDDGHGGSLAASAQVQVEAVNDAPVIASAASATVDEGTTAALTVQANDPDSLDVMTYGIAGGADAALFEIDPATGELRFKAAPDFESPTDADGDNVYDIVVRASDGSLFTDQAVTVSVGNVNEAPRITSPAAVSVGEGSTAVVTLQAVDPDAGAVLGYSIVGGADAALFTIDAVTGALRFKTAPAFDTPTDAGADNVYNVSIAASDGALSTRQDLAVTVTEAFNFITGTPLADKLNGTAGKDWIDGGLGADRMAGFAGNDTYVVDSSGDKVTEVKGEGTDTIRTTLATYVLGSNVENLLFTDAAAHTGTGNSLANVLTGGAGADVLAGMGGIDRLTGGAGADTFAFSTVANAVTNLDTITDFVHGVDRISFSKAVFTGFAATGAMTAGAFWGGAGVTKAHDADDRVIYNTTTGALYYDADGTGSTKAVQVAVLTGTPVLDHTDFLIVA
jgi:VCBS repeat-containing protein